MARACPRTARSPPDSGGVAAGRLPSSSGAGRRGRPDRGSGIANAGRSGAESLGECDDAVGARARVLATSRRVVAPDLGARALGVVQEIQIVNRDDCRRARAGMSSGWAAWTTSNRPRPSRSTRGIPGGATTSSAPAPAPAGRATYAGERSAARLRVGAVFPGAREQVQPVALRRRPPAPRPARGRTRRHRNGRSAQGGSRAGHAPAGRLAGQRRRGARPALTSSQVLGCQYVDQPGRTVWYVCVFFLTVDPRAP